MRNRRSLALCAAAASSLAIANAAVRSATSFSRWNLCCSSSASAFIRGVISRNTRTTPRGAPRALRIAAEDCSISICCPFLDRNSVRTCVPSPSARPEMRRSSFTVRNTARNGMPTASSGFHPVRSCATELSQSMLPNASVVMTASPIDCIVTRSRSCCSASDSARRLGSVMSRFVPIMRVAWPVGSRVSSPALRM